MPRDLSAPAVPDDRDTLLLAAQLELVVGVASGEPLPQALDTLLRVVEKVTGNGLLASVLLLDPSGRKLLHGSAPNHSQQPRTLFIRRAIVGRCHQRRERMRRAVEVVT